MVCQVHCVCFCDGRPCLFRERPNPQAELTEKCRGLEARLHVHERRHSAELGRWRAEADRADELAGKIGTAENERDVAVKK